MAPPAPAAPPPPLKPEPPLPPTAAPPDRVRFFKTRLPDDAMKKYRPSKPIDPVTRIWPVPRMVIGVAYEKVRMSRADVRRNHSGQYGHRRGSERIQSCRQQPCYLRPEWRRVGSPFRNHCYWQRRTWPAPRELPAVQVSAGWFGAVRVAEKNAEAGSANEGKTISWVELSSDEAVEGPFESARSMSAGNRSVLAAAGAA